ncbi:zinc metallopeptidase [Pseudanabaena galeata UHCC 0370]|uniref:Zinc metallopeptidase n=1 Tax=Pseudanabaena galeata UHCC 0370 TaxID=3110310 RepID=A0ABU5TR45_9CYAN|nr:MULTISPECIES: zinc metallopeptidase [Pseudanabaena]MEA5479968.1 zinc metallopeptidase [Pseudanabaena galeata UHCC 0370]MEA5486904.1 zinc metallopeptidase [Pseudanabaena sp. CCNP1317]WGS72234.1 zinc metallopeptidase [Pseudanabaena galeata CCNP1313]
MFFHPSYLILIPGMILMFWAQQRVKATYEKYADIRSSLGMTGEQVAKTILQRMGIHDVTVEQVAGELTDHYDPSAKAVRLSESVYASSSLAAAAIAAHECGHVLQDVRGYQFMNIRASLVPVANIGANFGPIMVMAGLFLTSLGSLSVVFINIGIALFASAILFHIVTLPVEFDASSRALRLIDELGILQGEENRGARKVLNAAAWTYVATAIYAALQLVQLLLIRGDR